VKVERLRRSRPQFLFLVILQLNHRLPVLIPPNPPTSPPRLPFSQLHVFPQYLESRFVFFISPTSHSSHALHFSLSHNHHLTTFLATGTSSHHFRRGSHPPSEGLSARAQALSLCLSTPRSPGRITVAYINPIIANLCVSDSCSILSIHLAGDSFLVFPLFFPPLDFLIINSDSYKRRSVIVSFLHWSSPFVTLPNAHPQALVVVRHIRTRYRAYDPISSSPFPPSPYSPWQGDRTARSCCPYGS